MNPESKFAERWKDKLPQQRMKFADKIKNNITTSDILFTFRSPSGAACFCSGQSVSGPKCWFDTKGISLENKTK